MFIFGKICFLYFLVISGVLLVNENKPFEKTSRFSGNSMNKITSTIVIMLLFLSVFFRNTVITARENNVRNSIINFTQEEIIEITGQTSGPQYNAPDKITITYDGRDTTAKLVYSGLWVTGQENRTWERKKPGKKDIPVADYNKLVEMLKDDSDWFKITPPSHWWGGMQFVIIVKSRLKNNHAVEKTTILYPNFKDRINYTLPEHFKKILKSIGDLYNHDLVNYAEYD